MSRNDVITTAPARDYDVTYKVLLLGDSGVGKTSLIRALSPNSSRSSRHILPTVGKLAHWGPSIKYVMLQAVASLEGCGGYGPHRVTP